MSRLQAALFDLDGLLVDTEPLWTRAEEELAAQLGQPWAPEVKALIAGTRLDLAVPTILEYYRVPAGPERVAWASGFLLDRMVELFGQAFPVAPGALELVDALRARGLCTALVSSSYRVLVDAALARLGAHRFDLTLAGDEVGRGKPDPMPYLLACERLGVCPQRCVVLEDAPAGVAAAEAAGCLVVAVPSVAPVPATARRTVVARLADVDPEWLLSLV